MKESKGWMMGMSEDGKGRGGGREENGGNEVK